MNSLQNTVLGKGSGLLERVYRKLGISSIEVLAEKEVESHIRSGEKTVLCVMDKYHYGNKNWGLSYPYYNFYLTLTAMGYSLVLFESDRIVRHYGKSRMSQMLLETVYCYQPDILFYVHANNHINHDVWREVSRELPMRTIYWQSDDHHQYENTQPVWELFNIVVTTDRIGYERRKREGFNGVVLSQYASNHLIYRNLNLSKIYGVSFVGQCYGNRFQFINTLRENGVDVTTFGQWWGASHRVTQSDLIRITNQTKISLNLSLASRGGRVPAVKGRDFEAPSCGSMLLTLDTEEIAEYFVPGEEIITYHDTDDATEKIKYYLANDDARETIAKKGYDRVLRDHTWEKRLTDIFACALENNTESTLRRQK